MNGNIEVSIRSEPYRVPERKDDSHFFACRFRYSIPEKSDKSGVKIVHCGSEGSHSIKQIGKEFQRILKFLTEQKQGKETGSEMRKVRRRNKYPSQLP